MTFAQVEWLLLLIAIPILALVSWLAWRRRGERWRKLVAERLSKRLSHSRPAWVHFTSFTHALLGLAGLIVALAQPESGEEWIEVEAEGRNILFCVDISRSMLATDVAPNRLLAARAAALEVLEKFPSDRVGVLLFSGNVLIQSPLTIDHGFVEETLAQLEPDDIPSGGSDLTKAIREGTALLMGTGQRNNIMVVFSDGEQSSSGLEAAATDAADGGVFIYALGFGKEGGFIPDPKEADGKFRDRDGRPVYSKLDEDSLRTIAELTKGFYSRGIGRDFLFKLDRALSQMDRFEETGQHQRVAKPAHKWFLLGGLLLLMSSLILRCFPRRSLGVVLACLVFNPPADASLIGEGRSALEKGDYAEAYRAFESAAADTSGERAARLHLAAGSAAFSAKDWTPAADSFSEALASADPGLQHEAHYGLATSLFYLGAPLKGEDQTKAWEGAVKHYEHALQLQPDDQRAADNLNAILQLLQKKEQEEQQQDQKQDQKSDDEKKDEEKKESGDENEGESEKKSDQEKKDGGDQGKNQGDQKPDDQKQSDQNQEPQKPDEGEGDQKEAPDSKGESEQEKGDGKGKSDPKNQREQDEPKPGDGEEEQNTKNSDDPGDREDETEMKPPSQNPELAEPTNESPEERARRLLRQFADFGAKAPRHSKRPFRRSAHDW